MDEAQVRKQAEELVAQMTLDEAAAQLKYNAPAIERLGIPEQDAWDYSSDGCWEVLIYGKTEYSYGHIELMPCMEALFNRGCSMSTGKKIGIDFGEDALDKLDTFDKFYEAYWSEVQNRIDGALQALR